MAAEALTKEIDLYRFKEIGNTYSSICILVYEGDSVLIKGLPLGIDLSDVRELVAYITSRGITKCKYERRKNGKTLYKNWSLNSKCVVREGDGGG